MSPILDVSVLRADLVRQGARRVAIDGFGASGKSTLARQLAGGWPGAVVIEIDDFYKPSGERVQRPDRHGGNWDLERLAGEVLVPLGSGRPGRYQRYDWGDDRLAEWHDVPADAVVLVDGVYSTSELLRGYFDYKIWVNCRYEVRLQRGVERDGEAMRAVWINEWMPAEDRYFQNERPDLRADLVIDGSGDVRGVAYRFGADAT